MPAADIEIVAMCNCSNEQLEAGRSCKRSDCPNAPAEGDAWTVSLMAEHERTDGVFEDVILGTYPDKRAALKASREHVKVNPDSQAQVMAALPHSPEFTSWDSLKALVYMDDEYGVASLVVERF